MNKDKEIVDEFFRNYGARNLTISLYGNETRVTVEQLYKAFFARFALEFKEEWEREVKL